MNKSAFDLFTIAHFAVGIWAGQFFTPLQVAGGMTVFELSENGLKKYMPGLFPTPGLDSMQNSIVDVLSAYAGAAIVRYSMKRQGVR